MAARAPTLAIILPAYNEAVVIGSVLKAIPESLTLRNKTYPIHIIVVNDASTDDTAKKVRNGRHIHVINHLVNCGAGAATRTGLTYAKQLGCSYAITMDADGQHHPKDVIKLARTIVDNKADVIIGSRLLNSKGMPWYRILGNTGLSVITFLIFGVFVSDSQSGMKALNERALHTLTFHSNDYAFSSEMVWRAKQAKLRIREMPIRAIYTHYSLKKGQSNWGVFPLIRQLIKHRLSELING